jgi:hypothetical protein
VQPTDRSGKELHVPVRRSLAASEGDLGERLAARTDEPHLAPGVRANDDLETTREELERVIARNRKADRLALDDVGASRTDRDVPRWGRRRGRTVIRLTARGGGAGRGRGQRAERDGWWCERPGRNPGRAVSLALNDGLGWSRAGWRGAPGDGWIPSPSRRTGAAGALARLVVGGRGRSIRARRRYVEVAVGAVGAVGARWFRRGCARPAHDSLAWCTRAELVGREERDPTDLAAPHALVRGVVTPVLDEQIDRPRERGDREDDQGNERSVGHPRARAGTFGDDRLPNRFT